MTPAKAPKPTGDPNDPTNPTNQTNPTVADVCRTIMEFYGGDLMKLMKRLVDREVLSLFV